MDYFILFCRGKSSRGLAMRRVSFCCRTGIFGSNYFIKNVYNQKCVFFFIPPQYFKLDCLNLFEVLLGVLLCSAVFFFSAEPKFCFWVWEVMVFATVYTDTWTDTDTCMFCMNIFLLYFSLRRFELFLFGIFLFVFPCPWVLYFFLSILPPLSCSTRIFSVWLLVWTYWLIFTFLLIFGVVSLLMCHDILLYSTYLLLLHLYVDPTTIWLLVTSSNTEAPFPLFLSNECLHGSITITYITFLSGISGW